jgi:hypothetical protein
MTGNGANDGYLCAWYCPLILVKAVSFPQNPRENQPFDALCLKLGEQGAEGAYCEAVSKAVVCWLRVEVGKAVNVKERVSHIALFEEFGHLEGDAGFTNPRRPGYEKSRDGHSERVQSVACASAQE